MKAAGAALRQIATGLAPGANAAARGRGASGGSGTDPVAPPPAAQPPAGAGSAAHDTVAASLAVLAEEGNPSSDALRARLRSLLASLGVEEVSEAHDAARLAAALYLEVADFDGASKHCAASDKLLREAITRAQVQHGAVERTLLALLRR